MAIEARLLRRTAKVKEEARRLWNVFQDAEAKMATMKKRQQKPTKEKARAAVPITAGSRRLKKPTKSKWPRPAAGTPQKKRKPPKKGGRTVSSDPSSESSSSSDSDDD